MEMRWLVLVVAACGHDAALIDAEPAHNPGVGERVSLHVATSRHEPGMAFAVHVGAALASAASGNTGGVHAAASAGAASPLPRAASISAAS